MTNDERDYLDAQVAIINERINGLTSLSNERLTSISTQFHERDVRQEREAQTNRIALEASFNAQKEAINKLSELFKSTTDGLTVNINDLKDRVLAMESTKRGATEIRNTTAQTTNLVIGLVGLVLAAVVFAVGLYLSSKGAKV